MEACIVPVSSCFHQLKIPFIPNVFSSPPFCSIPTSSNFRRQKSSRVKPISALSSNKGSGKGLEERRVSHWVPRLEDLDATNMLLRQRIVFLCSEVDDINADFIISQLLLLDAENSMEDIKFFINSPGGSVTAGMGIYDAMKLCKADVSTICFGLAASMGAFLLAAGTKGKRFCMPNSKVMIHQPHGGAGGGFIERGLQSRELKYHKIKFEKLYSRITGKSVKQIEEDTANDYFLTAWEAVDYGIVDAVIDEGKPGLVAPIGDSTYPPKFGLWHYHALYDRMKPLPSEENLVKKKVQVAEESSDEKDSNQVKERKQFVYDIPYKVRSP